MSTNDECINTMHCVPTVQYHLAIKSTEVPLRAPVWVNLGKNYAKWENPDVKGHI
jgi:hypothetical protein